ncbi:MAG: cytochrome c [Phenylobacterium sp.]
MRRIAIILALLAVAGGCATSGRPMAGGAAPGSAVERGHFFVQRSCAGCHAVNALGDSPNAEAPPFRSVRMRHNEISLERMLADISQKGHFRMPPVYMSDAEIADIVAYIQTVEPARRPGAAALPQGRHAQLAASRPLGAM